MKKRIKLFIIYFPVILVSFQVLVNIFSLISPYLYNKFGLVLNTLFGVNLLFAAFLVAFTYWFRFCSVSRYAAWSEMLFAINYLFVQEDNLYNIVFQIIVGIGALMLTFRYFIIKFPLCKIALLWRFMGSVFLTGSCSRGLEMWEQKTYQKIQTTYNENRT